MRLAHDIDPPDPGALCALARPEPLRRVHECVLGALAIELQPVDQRR